MKNDDPAYIIPLLLGMAAVTYLPRMLPLTVLSRTKLPPLLARWLTYIPPAVLAALLAQELLVTDHRLALPPANWYPVAAAPAFAVALRTRSLLWTVVAGMAAIVLLRLLDA